MQLPRKRDLAARFEQEEIQCNPFLCVCKTLGEQKAPWSKWERSFFKR